MDDCSIVLSPLAYSHDALGNAHPHTNTHTHTHTHQTTHTHTCFSSVDVYLCGIALGPLASYTVMLFATCGVLLSDAANQRIMGVAVGEK